MSNIWHTVDETPKPYEDVAFYVDGYLYSSYYEPQHNQYGIFGADKVEKWCYAKDLSSYILALETDLGRTRKALERIKKVVDGFGWGYGNMHLPDYHDGLIIAEIVNEALEQKE